MVEFIRDYTNPMEREYFLAPVEPEQKIEEPIIPISEIGMTVPEQNPQSGAGILQNVESAIRLGAKKIGIVMNIPSHAQIGGRPKGYGKDTREAIREMIRANEVEITGVEAPPSSITNLSGFDPQTGNISETKRMRDLQELKETVRFAIDIAGGGGVDIWSQEYPRDITDAEWNKNKQFFDVSERDFEPTSEYSENRAIKSLINTQDGKIMGIIQKNTKVPVPKFKVAEKDYWGMDVDGEKKVFIRKGDWIDENGNFISPFNPKHLEKRVPIWDPKERKFEVDWLRWEDMEKKAEDYNKRFKEDIKREFGREKILPEEVAFQMQMDNQIMQARGQSLYYSQGYERYLKEYEALEKVKKFYKELEGKVPKEEQWRLMREDPMTSKLAEHFGFPTEKILPSEIIEARMIEVNQHLQHAREASSHADVLAKEAMEHKKRVQPLSIYAKQKSVESYADLGYFAFKESHINPKVIKPIYVGPELGWPTAYGGHPDEFIELIKKSREKLAKTLMEKEHMSEDMAKREAEKHIKGTLDTSHLGMWLYHFKGKPGESEDEKIKRFNKWFLEEVEKMQKENVIGDVQIVDTAGAEHAHLPPGQGILPIKETVTKLRELGFKGAIISEGHEEERYGRGRIITEAWKLFGSPVGETYRFGEVRGRPTPFGWNYISQAYFGATTPITYIAGSYVPSNDWQLWSEVPFE